MVRLSMFQLFIVLAVASAALSAPSVDMLPRRLTQTPLRTSITAHENGDISSTCFDYYVRSYRVCELGNIRLAIKMDHDVGAADLLGKSGIWLSHIADGTGISGNPNDKQHFVIATADGSDVVDCLLYGVPFQVMRGDLLLFGKRFPTTGKPLLIVVAGGKISEIRFLPRVDVGDANLRLRINL